MQRHRHTHTLNYAAFEDALRALSVEAAGGRGDEEAKFVQLCARIAEHGVPSLKGTTATKTGSDVGSGVFAKLTDPSLYTGASKERFE